MSLILNIDTAAETSLVQLEKNGEVLCSETNPNKMDHAAFIHPTIKRIFDSTGASASSLDAIAVTEGPGSYTGIRIGMATAKGLCLATGKPLILLNRLFLMAAAMNVAHPLEDGFYCPMMDARRMEVFNAVYSSELKEVLSPNAHILSTESFLNIAEEKPFVVSGSGAEKFLNISSISNVHKLAEPDLSKVFAQWSHSYFLESKFSNLVDSQPFYAKDFYIV